MIEALPVFWIDGRKPIGKERLVSREVCVAVLGSGSDESANHAHP